MSFGTWRVIHRTASAILGGFAVLHSILTAVLHDSWSPDAVWFLGTGLGLFLLAAANWSHVGIEPCNLPTARVVRWANYVFVAFGIGAVIAVPEPQAFVILGTLVVQAVAGTATLQPVA